MPIYLGSDKITINPKIVINEGGGGKFTVIVIDYDGTVLKSEKLDTNQTFTLPYAPSHEGLIFQGWSSPVTITNNTVTVTNSDIVIGPMYTTESGLSEFDITLTNNTGKNVTFNMSGTKDWGDGTSDDTTSHTYSNNGNYTIKCNGTLISNKKIFNGSSFCTAIRLANNITNIFGFDKLYNLKYITIPNSVTTIGSMCFEGDRSLTALIVPSNVTEIYQLCYSCDRIRYVVLPKNLEQMIHECFQNCYFLRFITLPEGITYEPGDSGCFTNCHSLISITIPASITEVSTGYEGMFQYCYGLKNVILSEGIEVLGEDTFYGCNSLEAITFPSTLTRLSYTVFGQSPNIEEYDFSKLLAVPELEGTDVFSDISPLCKIKVPSNLYNQWIATTNWVNYESYIVPV